MREQIEKVLLEKGGIPLFFSEAGSRAYGVHNDRSDYDVRGLFLPPRDHYFDFRSHPDHITQDDGTLDFSFFSLDKAFGLLANSNPSVLEWVRSSIIYMNELPDWEEFKEEVLKQIEFRALFHHHRSLAKSHFKLLESGRTYTYKALFYCIRGVISAELAGQSVMPAMMVDVLFDQFEGNRELIEMAGLFLERKKSYREKEELSAREAPGIMKFIEHALRDLESKEPASCHRKKELIKVLSAYSIRVKELHYC